MAGTIIEDSLVTWIESRDYAAALGVKCYPWGDAPQSTATRPFVLFHRISGGRVRSLSGPSGLSHPRIQLDVCGREYEAVRDFATKLREELDSFRGDMAGRTVQVGMVHDDFDYVNPTDITPQHGTEQPEHRVVLDMTIWFEE